jgi:NAD(P)-dependent dehydrogenase (short-subunit alcohol dehydrogenase family)
VHRSIFITGGGSGIGRAVAQHFAARGWFVGLADVSESGMAETAALLPAGQSHSQTLDVRDRARWDAALAAFAEAAGGRIHVVFNNAGVGAGGTLDQLSQDEIDTLIDINFRGVVYGAQAAYPYLKDSAPGSALVNTSSAAGNYGTGGLALYSATKFAVRGLTEALDIEWHADRIKVCSLMPSFVDTPILDAPNNRNFNVSRRDSIIRAGFEFIPVETVAEAMWQAVHGGKQVHNQVGKVARQLAFGARWMPHLLRRRLTRLMAAAGLGRI